MFTDTTFLQPNLLQIKNLHMGECFSISLNDSTKSDLQICDDAPVWEFIYKTDLPAYTIKYSSQCVKLPTR